MTLLSVSLLVNREKRIDNYTDSELTPWRPCIDAMKTENWQMEGSWIDNYENHELVTVRAASWQLWERRVDNDSQINTSIHYE